MDLEQFFVAAKQRVQRDPTDLVARSMVWQSLAAREEWSRAGQQLEALLANDSSWALEVQLCQRLLLAEQIRAKVFQAQLPPPWIGEAPAWGGFCGEALSWLANADQAAAVAALTRVRAMLPQLSGRLAEQAFDWICDGDARLTGVLELVVGGEYRWLPLERLQRVRSRSPIELRDRLWVHAQLELRSDEVVEAFLPARYPFPQSDAERVGATTEWLPLGEDLYLGRGQKMFMTDGAEYGYLDVRELSFE